jgi:hypothetical protein
MKDLCIAIGVSLLFAASIIALAFIGVAGMRGE